MVSREVAVAEYAMAVLHNGLGNYALAQAAAERAAESDELGTRNVDLPELIEAAVRAGHPDIAVGALEQSGARALACNPSWALDLAGPRCPIARADQRGSDRRGAIPRGDRATGSVSDVRRNSREVAAQLFPSPRTIEAHLRNIFSKLGITSRRPLKDLQLT